MNRAEQLQPSDFNAELKLRGFIAYQTHGSESGHKYNRKDFYKISLNTGTYSFHYADRSFTTGETILFFGNPRIPYACEVISHTNGYACLFTEEFLKLSERSESLLQSPLFKLGGTPVLQLNQAQKASVALVYEKMITEQDSDYTFKDELIRSYIGQIIHEALKMQPSGNSAEHKNAAVRITAVFLDLLERQFPIDNPNRPLELRTARDFASRLSVHVNHLNSSVKRVTGKPTTTHIADRMISEANALLQHTDWTITDIAYALGFDYPTYFNNFFKKKTGHVPTSVRAASL